MSSNVYVQFEEMFKPRGKNIPAAFQPKKMGATARLQEGEARLANLFVPTPSTIQPKEFTLNAIPGFFGKVPSPPKITGLKFSMPKWWR